MSWCFAKVNSKLAEIYFEDKRGKIKILGHCYVRKEKYKTKKEQKWIEKDSSKFQFRFNNRKYKDLKKPVKNLLSLRGSLSS